MSNSPEVLLCSTLHDPKGVFTNSIARASAVVLQNYQYWVINTTTTTQQRIKDTITSFRDNGMYLSETDPSSPLVTDPIENDHMSLLSATCKIAQTLGIRRIQYTDGDRIIVAGLHYPNDLKNMALAAGQISDRLSYLNFRRSPKDYFAHHPPLVQTELEFNRFYSELFGMPIDISSTSHVMSIDVLQKVLERSAKMRPVSFPHPKWLLIAKEMGANISSVETENVLTFETPEQFRGEVAHQVEVNKMDRVVVGEEAIDRFSLKAGDIDRNYQLLQQVYMATFGLTSTTSSREWELRFNTTRQYLELLEENLTIFEIDENEAEDIRSRIRKALISLEGRKRAILESLPDS